LLAVVVHCSPATHRCLRRTRNGADVYSARAPVSRAHAVELIVAMRAPTPACMSAALAKYARDARTRVEAIERLAALLAVLEAAALPAASPRLGDARSATRTYDLTTTELAQCLCNEDGDGVLRSAWYTQLASVWRAAVRDDGTLESLETCVYSVVGALLPLVPAPASVRALRKRCRDGHTPMQAHMVAALDAATSALPTVP